MERGHSCGELDKPRCSPEERTLLNIIKGAFQSVSRQPRRLTVNTPYLNGMIEGTEFVVRVEDYRATLSVLEGKVLVSNGQGSLKVAPGESATAEAGKAPQLRTVVRRRDAVEWSLYYPPVLTALGRHAGDARANVPPRLREGLARAGRGDPAAAFQALDRVAESDRDASFYLQRAALLLSVGSVAEARTDIDAALKHDPKAGLAYALRSIIHVVTNEREQGLADAERAVSLSSPRRSPCPMHSRLTFASRRRATPCSRPCNSNPATRSPGHGSANYG